MTLTTLVAIAALLLLGSPARADDIDDLVAQVSLAELQGHVATLGATPRDSDESQAAAADYIAVQLESYGYTVFRHSVSGGFGLGTSENIVAQLAGTETPGRVFIVGAHFDSVQSSPGADDNASGVAGLLEMARVLAGSSFASSIELVAFAHEEIGLLGSHQHATAAWAAGRDVIGMISLEMIGYTCFTPGCAVIFPDILPCFDVQGSIPSVLGDWIGVVANADHAGLGELFFDAGARYVPSLLIGWATVLDDGSCFPDTRRSDHAPFWDYGYPALMVTDTANFRNPNYHGVGDVSATLDFLFAQRVTQAALATMVSSASAVDEPGPTATPKATPIPSPTPTPLPPTHLNNQQQACVNEMNRNGEKVNKAQLKEHEMCLKDHQKGKLTTTFEMCLTDDPKNKIQKADDKTVQGEAKKCDPLPVPPPFAFTSSTTVFQAGVDGAMALSYAIFGGPPVQDAVLATKVDDKDKARCQLGMLKQTGKLENAILKDINKAKKAAIKTPWVGSVSALEMTLTAVFTADDKLAKAEEKLVKGVEKKCASLQDPAATFPGACADPDLDEVENCVIAAVRCQACLQINAMDNLALDCDDLDNGTANGSCP